MGYTKAIDARWKGKPLPLHRGHYATCKRCGEPNVVHWRDGSANHSHWRGRKCRAHDPVLKALDDERRAKPLPLLNDGEEET